jgi:hypothetical protein
MHSRVSFFLGFFAGLFLSFLVIQLRYLNLLPPHTLSASKQDIACSLLHCEKPGRLDLTAQTLISLATRASAHPSSRDEILPVFHDPAFWTGFGLDKKTEIQEIAKQLVSWQENAYKNAPKDMLLIQVIASEAEQKIRAGRPASAPWQDAQAKILALAADYASKSKASGIRTTTPPQLPSETPPPTH